MFGTTATTPFGARAGGIFGTTTNTNTTSTNQNKSKDIEVS